MNRIEDQTLAVLEATHAHPHQWLGMHHAMVSGISGLVVRAFFPEALSCTLLAQPGDWSMDLDRVEDRGFFEGFISDRQTVFPYRLRIEWPGGNRWETWDPYSFLPTLSNEDLYRFNEGTERQIYNKLGARYQGINGISGTAFAVWAPNARRVSVIGDFNRWDGRRHPMRSMGSSGVWELFIPGLEPGSLYKYELIDVHGQLRIKTDPYGSEFEEPPNCAARIPAGNGHAWRDGEWMEQRARTDWLSRPLSIYEIHLGSWRRIPEESDRPLGYRELAAPLVAYLGEQHYTHVEFMPICEHPFTGSWGYQVTGFFAPTHRYGSPDDFRYLVDELHRNGYGIILDWVPAHFPRDAFALAEFDGTRLYEHEDPRQGEHQDWGTLIFNYGRPEVRSFLIGSALSWCDRFHIDGLRVDAVASMLYLDYSREEGQWIANPFGGRENIEAIDFLQEANDSIHENFPGVLTIAEESTAWDGVTRSTRENGLGFDLKWNMGWMHDILRYFGKDPVHRKWHQNELTFGAMYQNSERFNLAFSHDEVVHGKGSMIRKMGVGSMSEKARNLRALYGWMWGWPGKKTLFMGSDFGQSDEWHQDRSLDWHLLRYQDHAGIRRLIADLNEFYIGHPSLGASDFDPRAFQWISHEDHDACVLSFMRRGAREEHTIVVIANFTPVDRENYRIGLPHRVDWEVVVHTDDERYGGSPSRTERVVPTEPVSWNGQPYSMVKFLPGMSTLFLAPVGR